MSMAQKVMERFYRDAGGDPTRLPWHNEEPSPFLARAVAEGAGTQRALDVGCGSGVFSGQMADMGLRVTALDFLADAVAMARSLAERHPVGFEVEQADVLAYAPETRFDLVFDSGCLHSLCGGGPPAYKSQLLRWLEPGGNFVLGHWGKRHALDWRPIGPRRRTQEQLERLFAPELELVDSEARDEKVPFPFGPRVRMASYWFRRTA